MKGRGWCGFVISEGILASEFERERHRERERERALPRFRKMFGPFVRGALVPVEVVFVSILTTVEKVDKPENATGNLNRKGFLQGSWRVWGFRV